MYFGFSGFLTILSVPFVDVARDAWRLTLAKRQRHAAVRIARRADDVFAGALCLFDLRRHVGHASALAFRFGHWRDVVSIRLVVLPDKKTTRAPCEVMKWADFVSDECPHFVPDEMSRFRQGCAVGAWQSARTRRRARGARLGRRCPLLP